MIGVIIIKYTVNSARWPRPGKHHFFLANASTAKQTQGTRPCTHGQELPEFFHKYLVHKQRNPPALNKENNLKSELITGY